MIDTGFLASIQNGFMPDSATIQRNTPTVSGDGQADSWATIATVSARLSPNGQGGREGIGGTAGIQATSPFRIVMPVGTDCTARDRIVVGSRTFEVNGTNAGGEYATALTAYCVEIS